MTKTYQWFLYLFQIKTLSIGEICFIFPYQHLLLYASLQHAMSVVNTNKAFPDLCVNNWTLKYLNIEL